MTSSKPLGRLSLFFFARLGYPGAVSLVSRQPVCLLALLPTVPHLPAGPAQLTAGFLTPVVRAVTSVSQPPAQLGIGFGRQGGSRAVLRRGADVSPVSSQPLGTD